ncbi:hypothetical protein CK503_13065 [Aliifodinibius salipaludis]|uniref:Uncharacterized protein n=1 Tax=Fodinibius salipaludis TaxID=2032627 RepID=A0A2A2G8C3_9BACT|nr:hypothetical protein [Aliifodinibius salipaludis]PAU93095.1 hypothetical protein CK503_13065 [Aliifodinibius salipaludis]
MASDFTEAIFILQPLSRMRYKIRINTYMDIDQKTNLISIIILLVCTLIAIGIYMYSGNIVVAIFIAPPIIHWILKKRANTEHL